MVQLMEMTDTHGPEKVRHPRLRNQKLLKIFSKLADGQENERKSCTESLVGLLVEQEQSSDEGIYDDTKYSVRRLVEGLSSSRKVARLGYSVALCQVLRHIDKVDIEMLLGYINRFAQSYGAQNNSKTMIKDSYIGKVFAYLVLVKSGKHLSGNGEHISRVVKDLMKMGAKKEYLPHLCFVAVAQIISQIKSKSFQKHVLPHIEQNIAVGWSECVPEDLFLILCAKKHHPKVMRPYLTDKWEDPDLISESTLPHIAGILKKTTKYYPVIHSVTDEIISEVIQQEMDLVTFWKTAVSPLFEEKATYQSLSIGLYIFNKLIPHLNSPKQVEEILYPCITKQLVYNNKEAVSMVMTLVEVTTDGATQLSVLKCLIRQSDTPQYSNMNEIIKNFVPEANVILVKDLKKAYTLQQSWISDKKDKVTWCKWCISALDSLVTKGEDPALQLDILQFFFIHSFFVIKKSSGLPHCTAPVGEHSDHVRNATRQVFFKSLTKVLSYHRKTVTRTTQFNQNLDVLFKLAQYGQQLLQDTDCVQLQSESLTEKAANEWSRMLEFLPVLQKKRNTQEKLGLNHAFELMFIYGGLQLFTDTSAVEFLQELHICYKKSTQRRKSKTTDVEPEWIEVITELLLSLMFKGSVLSRNISKTAMMSLAGHVTKGSLQLILDGLQQKSIEDEEGMVGVEDDDDDDDENDEDESDDENEEDSNDGNDEKNKQNGKEVNDEEEDDDDDDSDDNDDDEEKYEEANDDDDDDDDDSGLEEEGNIQISDDAKKKVKQALGEAAVDSDSNSEDESDLSDKEMFRLDEKLVEAFRALNKTKKKLDKEREDQLIQFRIRLLDLLEVIIKNNPSVHLLKEIIVPLIDRMERGHRVKKEQILGNKAKVIFDLMYKTRKMITDIPVDKDELFELFGNLRKLSRKVTTGAMMTEIVKGCFIVVRMILNLQGDVVPSPVKTRSKHKQKSKSTDEKKAEDYHDRLVSVVQSGILDMVQQKPGHCPMSFYCLLLDKLNLVFWPISSGLVEAANSTDIKIHGRADAVKIVARILNKQVVRELDAEDWGSFVIDIKCLSQKVLKTVSSKDSYFIKELLNLFLKVYQMSPDTSIKILGDNEMQILENMMSDFSQETLGTFRKIYRLVYGKEAPKKQQKRKNENKKGEQSSPAKKAKLENQSVANGNDESDDESEENEEEADNMDAQSTSDLQGNDQKHEQDSDSENENTDDVVAKTPVKSAVEKPSDVITPRIDRPVEENLTKSKRKKKNKKRKSTEMENTAVNEEGSRKKMSDSDNNVEADKKLTVLPSASQVNGSSPEKRKKKKRKSDKFSPRYTRSMK